MCAMRWQLLLPLPRSSFFWSDARTDGALVAINPVRIPPPRRRRTHPPMPPNSTAPSFAAAEYVEE